MHKVRHAAWAGQFYPGHPDKLEMTVREYLNAAPDLEIDGDIVGLIAPHAGYQYSGATAAVAYKQLQGRDFTHAVIIAPSHAEMFNGISVYNGDYYETPLGLIPVDTELAQAIASSGAMLRLSDLGHRTDSDRAEHSLEVQLPFLQLVSSTELKIVPIVFHDYRLENCRELADALAAHLTDKKAVIIASSDLYHGYSYEEYQETDRRTLEGIETFDGEQFCIYANQDIYQACGAGPIAALLMATKKMGATDVQVVAQTNSADVTGMRGGWTVGYASVLVIKKK